MAEYPYLEQFLGTHFHEDWTLDYESSVDAIRDFVDNWSRTWVEGVLADIRRLLAAKQGQVSDDDLLSLGAAINTEAEGRTPAQWLEWVASEISALLASRPS